MISWDYWQTLLAIFRGGNYAQAAKILEIDATTVGRRLKTLERKMGCALFLRNDGQLYPTNQCEKLLNHLEDAFESLRRAEDNSDTSGRSKIWRLVRITAPPFVAKNIYAPALYELIKQQRMQIELIGTGSNLNLTRREADIAIRIQDHPASIPFDTHNIVAEEIGAIDFAVYGPAHLNCQHLPWAGLTDAHIRTTGTETVDRLVGKQGLQFRVSQFDALTEIIASGAAKGMLPRFVAKNTRKIVQISQSVLQQPLWMLFHKQDENTPHQRAARQWIKHQTVAQSK